jgi:hypothetical protein
MDFLRDKEREMRILNTAGRSPLLALFGRKLCRTAIKGRPAPAAQALMRQILAQVDRRLSALGQPSFQFFVPDAFEYAGRQFGIDATWVYPEGAIDGVHISFLVAEGGGGFQFVVFDQRSGTVHDNWYPASLARATRTMAMLAQAATSHCMRRP